MAINQEMFRFVATRRPDRVLMHRINSRLIRDVRPATDNSLLVRLFGPGEFTDKLQIANDFVSLPEFIEANDTQMLLLEPLIDFFRRLLLPGVNLIDLAADFNKEFPLFADLLKAAPPAALVTATIILIARLWNSLYAQTIRGCDIYVTTNYLTDSLRVYHVLRLLWLSRKLNQETWSGGMFDDYEILIDLEKASTYAGNELRADPADAITEKKLSNLFAPQTEFHVPLSVGEIMPPTIGDLLLVEQDLSRYEMGELAIIESILQGERRERTTRTLSRTTQTTTTETSSEQETTNSLKTDERFQLSSQAQKTASENFSVQAGVNVTGKFGPVQVNASVNASYDTSQSSSNTSSQEYAKTVTEEATKRVKSSFKETSSITILSEIQDTTLKGFNNETGTSNINGLYRWVDKIYTARLLNYGRRLMFSFKTPEPGAFYRSLLSQRAADLLEGLEEPLHPSRISRTTLDHLPDTDTDGAGGFLSYADISETNFAKLAALYDVTGIEPPPPEHLTSSKAIVYPDAMDAVEKKVHDATNELSYVSSDNTLTLDQNYRITQLAVFACAGASGELGSYVDALKLGEVAAPSVPSDGTKISEADLILVQVANQSFYLSVRRDPDDSEKKIIKTNFNSWLNIDYASQAFGMVVTPSIPITITCKFEGIFTLTVMYMSVRTDEAYDAWKSQTYAEIIKGYTAKKQAYNQSLAAAEAKVQADVESKTYLLRDDQYRSIELNELKRGCIDLLTAGTAVGYTSITTDTNGTPRIVFDEAEGNTITNWRSPLGNGAVAEFFEVAFDWSQTTYEFYPYFWTGKENWADLAQATSADPTFEKFLQAGSANVVVPVRTGYERSIVLFLKTGRIWGGGYLPLFTSQDMLDIYSDVELGQQFDPPTQIGDTWEIRLPTNMVMLQENDVLPSYPEEEEQAETEAVIEIGVDESVPF